MRELVQLLIVGWAVVTGIMVVLWFVQRRTGNAGIVDVGWAASLAFLAVLYATLGHGFETRRLLIAIMGGCWGTRLAWYIHHRSHGKPEDGRYQQLRKDWAPHVQAKMFQFYQFQASAALLFSTPFLLSALQGGSLRLAEKIAVALWAIAFFGEALADRQLHQYKTRPDGKGKTCRAGLWRYSRHPNYFFEWLIWCSFALFAFGSFAPVGYFTVICPALIFFFLFKVTGIPATEAQALRTKGDDYREYQRTTSVFIPWFPKK